MDIDFVITWVDGEDSEWIREKEKYALEETGNTDNREKRFRSWDNLQYLFRGIEKNAPWVHKVYLITYGHYPKWLNLDNPKLVLIRHEDYIPSDWLPTFSSRTIDMNLHRIEGLSEHFVYFNDDYFIINRITPELFFKKGLPCDTAIMEVWPRMNTREDPFWLAPLIDISFLNRYGRKRASILKNWIKWFSPRYGRKIFNNIVLFFFVRFTGFYSCHCPYSYLKSTYEDLWSIAPEELSKVCSHKFRQSDDMNHWIFSYWQFYRGKFFPRSPKVSIKYEISAATIDEISAALKEKRRPLMCFNDNAEEDDFYELRERLNNDLNRLYPEKSSFEI
ncbi:MAG: Stealth CR1 domain-containing protein [Lachnospiraceae bacterium]|nr:Stealth CR1 domain-containing protein [Lachnospiraceae bacterium]